MYLKPVEQTLYSATVPIKKGNIRDCRPRTGNLTSQLTMEFLNSQLHNRCVL